MNVSGVYSIDPGVPMNVYCDMETDGGGWTVFQRRIDGSVDFFRSWSDYKIGFGSVSSEHWLGNEKIHRLTDQKKYELRIDLEDFDGNTRYANYVLFKMADRTGLYNLTVHGYSGTAGDGLMYHDGQRFSTPDRNNAKFSNCAAKYRAGWWFRYCFASNLNGIYQNGTDTGLRHFRGVIWRGGLRIGDSFKTCEMKIRPEPEVGSGDSQGATAVG
ncbi:ficolin-2-like [Strongylocentrotus purpuratus]|uniref:Fibrinogen C-terminal domain-containing protein n=1 Tax=Strongylocentrotus purpuratus TaxID=7668 RepID=A0A7M7P6G3_STRPU|nr:ficolin-2-like [Strongylocentrotus purpuratus]